MLLLRCAVSMGRAKMLASLGVLHGGTLCLFLSHQPLLLLSSLASRKCGGKPLSGVTRPQGMSRGRVVTTHETPP